MRRLPLLCRPKKRRLDDGICLADDVVGFICDCIVQFPLFAPNNSLCCICGYRLFEKTLVYLVQNAKGIMCLLEWKYKTEGYELEVPA